MTRKLPTIRVIEDGVMRVKIVGLDEFTVDVNEVTAEAEQYLRMLRDDDSVQRNTKLYRFARTIVAYKVLVKNMDIKLASIELKYDELRQEHGHLAERAAQELTVVNQRIDALMAKFGPMPDLPEPHPESLLSPKEKN
jgi:hypothetical protein